MAVIIDVESYSCVGFTWDHDRRKWVKEKKGGRGGVNDVQTAAYCEHPTTELISLAYAILSNTIHCCLWIPGCPPPVELFDQIHRGELVYAHNVFFDGAFWNTVCARMGWPSIASWQLRDTMAMCLSHSIPAGLGDACRVLGLPAQKDTDGSRLIRKFSFPRSPTKNNPALRLRAETDPLDGPKLYLYNVRDVEATAGLIAALPPLTASELEIWQLDQAINHRGVAIDLEAVDKLQSFVDDATTAGLAELHDITGGEIHSADEVGKIVALTGIPNLQKATVAEHLSRVDLDPVHRRVLEIRQLLGNASVKKLDAIQRTVSSDGRLRGIYQYQGADRTGRWAGRGSQPQNMPGYGPPTVRCLACGTYREDTTEPRCCPVCNDVSWEPVEWSVEVVEQILGIDTYAELIARYSDPLDVVSGCLRGLFIAGPGCDLLCSDFSAIEAVATAELAGERWRQEVFRTHGRIYEMSASKITGIPFEEIMAHREQTGQHHKVRKLGKVAELASGYSGWIGAWKRFGADKHMGSDVAIKEAILKWRAESPAIVEFWGGQIRPGGVREYYGIEGAAVRAVLNPHTPYEYRTIVFEVRGDVLYMRLPSERELAYHEPRLSIVPHRFYKLPIYLLSFMGVNRDPDVGPVGKWVRINSYGGRLVENCVQASCRDLLAYSMLELERAGYPIVLHTHDEPVAEVRTGSGSVKHFEAVMSRRPSWAADWPVKAAGGWRGRRYRKE